MTEIFASFLTVAQQIFILFLLVAVGFILGKTGLIDQNGSVVMSSWGKHGVQAGRRALRFPGTLLRSRAV